MSDIIKLLPDSVANQIAAGEVIQRPSSVVKELMENAIDAGATDLKVVIKDSGSTLIQVIDNGCGLSEMDARMAFERHATSKIADSQDLFKLRTNGFRGEALASIAAVAQVELKSKRVDDELGTQILISGSELESQENTVCSNGSNMLVKNLFYNVPARRRFLKKNEFTYIDSDFKRIALTYPDISMSLTHNDHITHSLPASNLRQRIVNVFGKSINGKLVSINSDTSLVNISGFVGTPESAKKSRGEQYFFVNGRYMKHPYFNRSVIDAYGRLLAGESHPSYFIFFDVDPGSIDVNVHPQKVEIKFENERSIFPILMATVKEAIGKFSLASQIDFDQENAPEIPIITPQTEVKIPKVKFNPDFNPFETSSAPAKKSSAWDSPYEIPQNESFLDKVETEPKQDQPETQQTIELDTADETIIIGNITQFFKHFIAVETEQGLMLIHQERAHERVLFEEIVAKISEHKMISQQMLFPQSMHLDTSAAKRLEEMQDVLKTAGFLITEEDEGRFSLNALPAEIAHQDGVSIIEQILEKAEIFGLDEEINTIIAETLATQGAIKKHQELSKDEMKMIVNRLFRCESPRYCPKGNKIMTLLSEKELFNL